MDGGCQGGQNHVIGLPKAFEIMPSKNKKGKRIIAFPLIMAWLRDKDSNLG